MNKFFRNLPLPFKLILIGFLPILFLLYLSYNLNKVENEKLEILSSSLKRINQATALTNVIYELQMERRYSFGYVVNKEWRKELVIQRPKTDASIKELIEISKPQLNNLRSYTFLNKLPGIRSKLDVALLQPNEVMTYFTNTIFRLNTLNNISAGNVIYLKPVYEELRGQKLLSEMATFLGFLRSNIYYLLYLKETNKQAFENIRSIYDLYNSYETELYVNGSAKNISAYKAVKASSSLKLTSDFLKELFENNNFSKVYNAEQWWEISADAVDQIRDIQKKSLAEAHSKVLSIHHDELKRKDLTVLFVIIMLAIVIFFISYTINSITKALNELKKSAELLSVGAEGKILNTRSKDAIGSLAKSIMLIDANNKLLADAADNIGKGKFNIEVAPRSEKDKLGNAILAMKKNLQSFDVENKEKLWINSGIIAINESIIGEKDVAQLAKDILSTLAQFLKCEIGFFYSDNEQYLQFLAGYAVDNLDLVPRKISYGETLVGQAAVKREILQIDQLPSNFSKVRSASGFSYPTAIIIIPLIQNNVLEGVIELGTITSFDARIQNFLNSVSYNIAMALHAAKSRSRLQELLEETQAQSEELQTQHSELENLNTELEENAQKLQASEEELKVQHEELLQANAELEERSRMLEERNEIIVERNEEIRKKAEELEMSSKYKSEFLANMSHELRTPLNSILLLSRLLSENNENNLSPDQVEFAHVIQSSGNGLLNLIDEILDLSKIESGKMELEYSSVMIEEVVADLKGLFSPIAKEKNLDFTITVDEKNVSIIETDRMRLDQILKNLLSNALKFTQKGTVNLKVFVPANNPNSVAFAVADTGIGIPKEKQHLIFEAFQQADGSTRRKFGGTGLGLSISKELAKLLGGEIHLKSEVGNGSTFTLYLPVHKKDEIFAEEIQTISSQQEETYKLDKSNERSNQTRLRTDIIPTSLPDDRKAIGASDKTILIIEDDTAFAKILLNFTHQKGYKGIVAVRGDEGIEMAQQYNPVGILLDIQLPVKDGWEVMEELKNNPQTRHIPVHTMSSHQVKKESLLKGAVDFINKPVSLEKVKDIFDKLERVISKQAKKVLIIEENPKHAKALAYFLETFNVASEISSNVNAGINALQKEEVDCVILDMGIPDKNGYETLETVKKDAGLENLPVIIFTGKNLSLSEETKIKKYADSIVVKTAHSYQRILDEVSLFLHLLEENKEKEKKGNSPKLIPCARF